MGLNHRQLSVRNGGRLLGCVAPLTLGTCPGAAGKMVSFALAERLLPRTSSRSGSGTGMAPRAHVELCSRGERANRQVSGRADRGLLPP